MIQKIVLKRFVYEKTRTLGLLYLNGTPIVMTSETSTPYNYIDRYSPIEDIQENQSEYYLKQQIYTLRKPNKYVKNVETLMFQNYPSTVFFTPKQVTYKTKTNFMIEIGLALRDRQLIYGLTAAERLIKVIMTKNVKELHIENHVPLTHTILNDRMNLLKSFH